MIRSLVWNSALLGAGLFAVAQLSGAPSEAHTPGKPEHGRITVVGIVTDEGVECPAIRAMNGRLYTLAGRTAGLKPGDRVQVKGRRAQASFCMQGITIEVERIRKRG